MKNFVRVIATLLILCILVFTVSNSLPNNTSEDSNSNTSSTQPVTYSSDEAGMYLKRDDVGNVFIVDKCGNIISNCHIDSFGSIYKDNTLIVPHNKAENFFAAHTMLLNDTELEFSVGDILDLSVSFFPQNTSCTEYNISLESGTNVTVKEGKYVFTDIGEAKFRVTSLTNPNLSDTCTVSVFGSREEIPLFDAQYMEYGKNILSDIIKMDSQIFLDYMTEHESDTYYLTTPYIGGNNRRPNGDTPEGKKPGMNCTGFVWHALTSAVKKSGNEFNDIPQYGGWVNFYRRNDVKRYRFETKEDMLKSGKLSRGDIIWIFDKNGENKRSGTHHIGFYWGDGSSDIWWHSLDGVKVGMSLDANMISHIGSLVEPNYYVVLDIA